MRLSGACEKPRLRASLSGTLCRVCAFAERYLCVRDGLEGAGPVGDYAFRLGKRERRTVRKRCRVVRREDHRKEKRAKTITPVKTHPRTRENAEQFGKDLEVLAGVGQLLATQSGQRQMLTAVLDELEEKLGMMRGTIMLLSSDGNELFVELAHDAPSEHRKDVRYRRGEGIVGNVVQTGQAAVIPQISREPRFTNRIHRRRKGAQADASFLCVPIALGREVVGTLSVDLPVQPAEQLHGKARFLGIVASMIAYDVKSRRIESLHRQSLEAENLRLRSALQEQFRPENIIGNSNAMREVYLKIHQVAASDTTVLVRGESGTGKELVASAIHYSSPRSQKPLVKVNLRRVERRAAGKRVVRSRERRFYRGPVCPRRPDGGGRGRDALPG